MEATAPIRLIYLEMRYFSDKMSSGQRKQRRGDEAVVKGAVAAILRGDGYADMLRQVVDLHLRNDGQVGPFQKTFLRATRLNMSLKFSETVIDALNSQPDQKRVTAELSRAFRKLDVALALNNTAIANAMVEKLLDRFDGLTGVKPREGRYAMLEHEVGTKLAKTDWALLKHEVIAAEAHSGRDPVIKSIAVGNVLDLGQRSQDQLLDFCVSVVDEVYMNLNSLQLVKSMSQNIPNANELLPKLDGRLAEEFGTTFRRILEANEIDGRKSIKAVLLYPLMIATLNPRRRRDPGLSGALIAKVVEMEPDLKLRSLIEGMDYAVSDDQKSKN